MLTIAKQKYNIFFDEINYKNPPSGASPVAKWFSLHTLFAVHRFGSWAQTYTPLVKPCCGSIPHRRIRITYNQDMQLCTTALGRGKKKRGRLATDVSSGPIFLTKERTFKKKKYPSCQYLILTPCYSSCAFYPLISNLVCSASLPDKPYISFKV